MMNFIYINSEFDLGEDIFSVCKRFKDFSFNCTNDTEFNNGDSGTNVDPDSNFYADTVVKCQHYTDNEFSMKLKNMDGFSIVHFNARSLKINFENIKLYLN